MQFTDNDLMTMYILFGWLIVVPLAFAGGGMLLVKRIVEPWVDNRFAYGKRNLLKVLFVIVWGAICLLGGFLLIPPL